MKPTISPKPLYYDSLTGGVSSKKQSERDIYFASGLEFEVWRSLVREFGRERVTSQVPLLVKPATDTYPDLFWRCDFRVYGLPGTGHNNYANVEAKGFKTEEFRIKLQLLELTSPGEFKRLIIIGGEKELKIDRVFSTVTIQAGIKHIRALIGK